MSVPSDSIIWETDGKEMVCIPAGEFTLGKGIGRKLFLPEFYIDRTPVTNAEYASFVQSTGYRKPIAWSYWIDDRIPSWLTDHPVSDVSWQDALAYAKWSGKQLPTREQWEKAARGSDARPYPWGDQLPTPNRCNYNRNMGGTTPVGYYSPQGDSPFGCVDMCGNVFEWVAHCRFKVFYMQRGGAWTSPIMLVNATSHDWDFARGPFSPRNIGFRLVMVPSHDKQ